MATENVLRLMEEKDTLQIPNLKEEFRKYAHHGDYFFCVIEDKNEDIVGYLVAEKKDEKLVITTLNLSATLEERNTYYNAAISNLYDYVKEIKNCEGKRIFYQVTFI